MGRQWAGPVDERARIGWGLETGGADWAGPQKGAGPGAPKWETMAAARDLVAFAAGAGNLLAEITRGQVRRLGALEALLERRRKSSA